MSRTSISNKTPKQMTPEAVEQAARADRGAQPLTEADFKRMKRTPQAKIIRRALELTQEEFAIRYHIPRNAARLGTGQGATRSTDPSLPDAHRPRTGSR
jgi:DNA-binding transcriptional regulator YiaG